MYRYTAFYVILYIINVGGIIMAEFKNVMYADELILYKHSKN